VCVCVCVCVCCCFINTLGYMIQCDYSIYVTAVHFLKLLIFYVSIRVDVSVRCPLSSAHRAAFRFGERRDWLLVACGLDPS
jgi:hypothetical protein